MDGLTQPEATEKEDGGGRRVYKDQESYGRGHSGRYDRCYGCKDGGRLKDMCSRFLLSPP